MGAAALQLSAVTRACESMLMRSFDGVNMRASLTATAASFLIILRHTRLLPLCLLPLPCLQVSLHPSLRGSIPPTLSCWPLPARSPQGKLPELGYSVRLHCDALLCSTHTAHTRIWTHKYSADMVLSRPDIPIISTFFCQMCV